MVWWGEVLATTGFWQRYASLAMTKMKIPVPIAPTVKLGLAWSSGLMRREKGVDLVSQSCGSFPREQLLIEECCAHEQPKTQQQNGHNLGSPQMFTK